MNEIPEVKLMKAIGRFLWAVLELTINYLLEEMLHTVCVNMAEGRTPLATKREIAWASVLWIPCLVFCSMPVSLTVSSLLFMPLWTFWLLTHCAGHVLICYIIAGVWMSVSFAVAAMWELVERERRAARLWQAIQAEIDPNAEPIFDFTGEGGYVERKR